MTLSFHQYEADQSFFPGTGSVDDFGDDEGMYSINVPILSGCTNVNYEVVFKNVVDKVFERFRPEAIVLQCGSNSVVGDRIGGFNLTIEGHGNAFKHVLSKNVPTVCLGGGGYMAENVSRCWTYESFVALGKEPPRMLPQNLEYQSFYTVTELLQPLPNIQEDKLEHNSKEYIFKLLGRIDELLKNVEIAPGTPFMERPNLEENRREKREMLELLDEGPAAKDDD